MRNFRSLLGVVSLLFLSPLAYASQPLETETARLLEAGSFRVETTFEYQTSSQGTETAVPLEFEYGIRNDLELKVEPVVYTAIRPKDGRNASGFGDLELTLIYRFFDETPLIPALAIAGEVKIPTTKNTLIGTGKTDYGPMLIASKQFGKWDTHVNFGYFILGEPSGVKLKNIFTYAAAAVYHLNDRVDLVGEVIGNTSSSPRTEGVEGTAAVNQIVANGQSSDGENSLTPEATGGEVSGMLGARYYLRSDFFVSLGVSYDNNDAVLLRPGFTWRF